jgi:hypothetical protein
MRPRRIFVHFGRSRDALAVALDQKPSDVLVCLDLEMCEACYERASLRVLSDFQIPEYSTSAGRVQYEYIVHDLMHGLVLTNLVLIGNSVFGRSVIVVGQ